MKTLKESILGKIDVSDNIILDELRRLDEGSFKNVKTCHLKSGVLTFKMESYAINFKADILNLLHDDYGVKTICIDDEVDTSLYLDSKTVQDIDIQYSNPYSCIRVFNIGGRGVLNNCHLTAGAISINACQQKLEVNNCKFEINNTGKPKKYDPEEPYYLSLYGFMRKLYKWNNNKLIGSPIVKICSIYNTPTLFCDGFKGTQILLNAIPIQPTDIQQDVLKNMGLDCGKDVKLVILQGGNRNKWIYVIKKPNSPGEWVVKGSRTEELTPIYRMYNV